jgi:hypothetical protein
MVAGSRRKVTPGEGCARGRFGSLSTAIGAVKAISVSESTDEHGDSIEWTDILCTSQACPRRSGWLRIVEA